MCGLKTLALTLQLRHPVDRPHTAAAALCPKYHSSTACFDGGGCDQEMVQWHAACSSGFAAIRRIPAV